MTKESNTRNVKKAVILAGGFGTRFLPATLALAKELFPIGNKPILMYHLDDLIKAGITEVLIIGNTFKESSFENFLNPDEKLLDKIESHGNNIYLEEYRSLFNKVKITYVNQDAKVLDFGGVCKENDLIEKHGSSIAVYIAKDWAAGEPFIVLNGDDLCIYEDGRSISKEVIDVFNATGDMVIYGKEMPREQIYKYSSMKLGEVTDESTGAIKISDIVEKPPTGTEPSNFMGFARYLFTSEVFDKIDESKPRQNGEFCITDVVQSFAREGKVSTVIFDGTYYDCGSMAGYVLANTHFGLKNESSANQVLEGINKFTKDAEWNCEKMF